MWSDVLLFGAVLLQVLCLGSGYPNGAPASACGDMMPRHSGVVPQPNPAPYTIQTSSNTFQAGVPITVVIKGPVYQGVLLEARSGSDTKALGVWKSPPANTKLLQCSGNSNGAITHANTNAKDNSTEYSWTPTDGTPSQIYFMATVAQQRTVYWLNVRSQTLSGGGSTNLATDTNSGSARQSLYLLLLLGPLSTQILHN
ncbi:putative defense protein 3 [Chanos chanos]|uniref:Defense protein 3 n=1 Tax=Chanos chanos TaxID=29144 RepID=A0A6J2WX49_CHACN|nr:putative defense protein 3 [Chanos chanos]